MVTAMHDKREQDNSRPEAFGWSISAICWQVEQNVISADGNPRAQTLKPAETGRGSQTKSGLFWISGGVIAVIQLLKAPNSIFTILLD